MLKVWDVGIREVVNKKREKPGMNCRHFSTESLGEITLKYEYEYDRVQSTIKLSKNRKA